MKINKLFFTVTFFSFLCACNIQEREETMLKIDQKESVEAEKEDLIEKNVLFDVLLLLPLNLGSWDWPIENRIYFIDNVQKGNMEIVDENSFFRKRFVDSTKIKVNVVDGIWFLKIYKASKDKYIVITDDIVSGGNEITSYVFKENNAKLEEISFEALFENTITDVFANHNSICNESLINSNFEFLIKYDFQENGIVMSNYYDNTREVNCPYYEEIIFEFNTLSEKFEFENGVRR